LPITECQPIKIRDIINKNAEDFTRFCIGGSQGKFWLSIHRKELFRTNWESLSIQTSAKRLVELANEILSYFKKEARLTEWKPTMQEFEQKIKEVMGEHAVEFWIIDWVRKVKAVGTKSERKQAIRIYEWLHSNRDWLYKE